MSLTHTPVIRYKVGFTDTDIDKSDRLLNFRPNLAASDVNAVHSGFRGQDGCPGDGDSDHPGQHPDTGNSR